jgi:hypothetical protein
MTPMTNARGRDKSISELTRLLANASAPQLLRIVAAVDGMSERGAADGLIAPLRHRLVNLHPTRPLRFARLVFLPLDPLIIPATGWRMSHCMMPRAAILPMAQVVETGLGAEGAAIKRAIHNRKADQVSLIATLGAALWPQAGSILGRSDVPPDWTATGLNDQAYRNLARRLGAVLSAAPSLGAIYDESAQGLSPPDPAAFKALVHMVSGPAPDALPMLAALLLLRLPQAAHLLYQMKAGTASAALRAATDQAADLLLDQLGKGEAGWSPIATSPLMAAGATAGRIAALLNELHRAGVTAARRKQLHSLRQKLDADCSARFQADLDTEFLASLRALPDRPGAQDISGLETTARSLRALEAGARVFGSGNTYDRLLAGAAETVEGRADRRRMEFVDCLRLVEILAGSEAALKLLVQN